ncbi:MAG: branched-chain amino acid ABC transporter permease [Propionibacteriales bacterium]|nr:branched-chain amino acid ABC transporter permease [Propionibacteriales bacterium]
MRERDVDIRAGKPIEPPAGSTAQSGSATRATRRTIIRDALAISVATGAYAVSFGALSVAAGLSLLQTCALSVLVFSGASQFAFVGVVAAGGAPLSGTATALLLGSRNALYGLRLAPLLRLRGLRRTASAQLVIDESTAMALNRETPALARVGFFATGLLLFAFWNAGTLVGALAGSAIGDPRDFGLDAAVAAAFVALIWPRLTSTRAWITAVGGTGVAVALVPVVPVGVPVLVAALVAVVVGWRGES